MAFKIPFEAQVTLRDKKKTTLPLPQLFETSQAAQTLARF